MVGLSIMAGDSTSFGRRRAGVLRLGEGRDLKMMGFGLAFAIFIDATVVRLALVPALMELMGEWNWYLPSWLRWLPVVRVDAEVQPQSQRPAMQPGAGGD